MQTPTTIAALEGAIEMLTKIRNGGWYSFGEYMDRLLAYEAARDEHRRLEMIEERNRAAIRELAAKRRAS